MKLKDRRINKFAHSTLISPFISLYNKYKIKRAVKEMLAEDAIKGREYKDEGKAVNMMRSEKIHMSREKCLHGKTHKQRCKVLKIYKKIDKKELEIQSCDNNVKQWKLIKEMKNLIEELHVVKGY